MKFQKIDPKQVPQVAGLAALSLAVFVFAAYSLLSASGGPTTKAAAQAAPAGEPEKPAETPGPEGAPGTGAPAQPGLPGQPGAPEMAGQPGLPLPEVYNSDPFRPAVQPKSKGAAAAPAPAPAPAPERAGPRKAQALLAAPEPAGAWPLPAAGPGAVAGSAPAAGAPAAPAAPAAPTRPELAVTGIIDASEGADMALVSLGAEQRIIQVGDLLPNNYRVKRIGMDGVLLVNGKDRYFVALGNKAQATSTASGQG